MPGYGYAILNLNISFGNLPSNNLNISFIHPSGEQIQPTIPRLLRDTRYYRIVNL